MEISIFVASLKYRKEELQPISLALSGFRAVILLCMCIVHILPRSARVMSTSDKSEEKFYYQTAMQNMGQLAKANHLRNKPSLHHQSPR